MTSKLPISPVLRALAGIVLLSGTAHADELIHGHLMAEESKADSPYVERKYAPSRRIDVLHVTIDVTPDFARRQVAGTTTLLFKPIAKPLAELRLDAVDLNISRVTATQPVRTFQVTEDSVVVTFRDPVPAGREVSVTLSHAAEPQRGMYFRTPQMGYGEGETHLFTQGETSEARHWFPTFDEPNEKFTSEVICHVPAGMRAFSNGRLIGEKPDAGGLVAFHWSQEQPHTSYLISLVAGNFHTIRDRYRDIPLAFHVLPSDAEQASNSFRNTRDMMGFFEQEIGVPYPWAKYDQICVNDFMFGGMENTSISTLTDNTLFTDATENIRSSDGLVAHELAHQWFGDLVTTKDWSHIWLNEGFATYYTHLYAGHQQGRDAMLYGLYNSALAATRGSDRKPIVYRQFDSPMEQFGYRAYPKGGWVLHMLRSQLGADLYRKVIRTYLERHRFGSVVTEDLNSVAEELSGRSFDRFFDQWVYHGHHPELRLQYSWDEKQKMARLSVAQTQKLDAQVLLFHFPVTVRFRTEAGKSIDRQIEVTKQTEDFYFALPQAPEIVRFDPEYTVLAQVDFRLANPMLYAQLRDQTDMIGRLAAIDQLATQKNTRSDYVTLLQETLQNDGFYAVRIHAAQALRQIHNDEALAALAASTQQTDARVRQAVVGALGGFYSDTAYAALQAVLEREQNPQIVSAALGAMALYPNPDVRELLLRYLHTDSYKNTLASSAVRAMREQGDPEFIAPLRELLQSGAPGLASRDLGSLLDAVAYVARNLEDRDELRMLVSSFTDNGRQAVRLAAIRALGTLEDPKAIALLQTFAGAIEDSPQQKAAEKAIASLRGVQRPADDLRALRQEVLELGKQTRELKTQLEELKKQEQARK